MKNERKTEKIVRSHFEKFEDGCLIEEQKSDNPKIQKLLKSASKKGTGIGMPEFIITPRYDDTKKKKLNLIIVIECKSDPKKHQSKTCDRYGHYAVDDVLLYSSFLSKEFDVLSIAVSGETKGEMKVTHFLQLAGEHKATEATKEFGNKLLPLEDYISNYETSDQKFDQDYEKLLTFSKELNETLHTKKVPESQRSLLISAILIALQNDPFDSSYLLRTSPKSLAKNLVDTVVEELQDANLSAHKIDNLKTAYGFILTHPALAGKKDVLRDLIKDIDDNVNQFLKTHKYYDVLGQFYIEFLRYANSDSKLGIVLTPPHITDLFCELADVNRDSVVFDNCTGTGGFLISAMRKMVVDAKGEKKKVEHIKEKQLIGVEYQDHIFALACSNMFIHGDGKTNLYNGDCFSTAIIAEAKKSKPNIGFLNPPYQTKKKTDIEEFEFVLNNLEVLEPNGLCVAIVPMQCVLAISGAKYELKKRLLDKHTLEAVFSMPDELFFNSDVNVVTAVIIVTAHKPHSPRKETFFGYWKDDGFIKRKNKGRIDGLRRWDDRKQLWLNSYVNRRSIAGLSVNKSVTAEDEWCAEAYMETDLGALSMNDFKVTALEYLSFLVRNEKFHELKSFVHRNTHVPGFNIGSWRAFKYSDLFEIKKGKRIVNEDMRPGIVPCIRPIDSNNGVHSYIDIEPNHASNTITVNYNGSVAEAFYQPIEYFALDDVNILYPKFNLNAYTGLFIATIIRKERYRFNYGRKWHLDRMNDSDMYLPVDKHGRPDWNYMENYILNLPYSSSI